MSSYANFAEVYSGAAGDPPAEDARASVTGPQRKTPPVEARGRELLNTTSRKQKDSDLNDPMSSHKLPFLPPVPLEPMHSRDSPGYEEARVGQEGVKLDEKMRLNKAERWTGDAGKAAIRKGEGFGERGEGEEGGEEGGGEGGREGGEGGGRISHLPRHDLSSPFRHAQAPRFLVPDARVPLLVLENFLRRCCLLRVPFPGRCRFRG